MRLAVLQTTASPDPAGNLDRLAHHLADAAAAGADLLVTPEMFLTGYAIGADAVRAAAEPLDGPRHAAVAALAREHGVAVVTGFPDADGDRVVNAVSLVDADGARRAAYRKTHLFGALDRQQFSAGDDAPTVVDLDGLRLGLLICYDVEFPEAVRGLALAGADAVLVPTANMVPYDAVAATMVPTRAYESQVYLAYANYVGVEGPLEYCGLSCIVGPDGVDRARADHGEALLVADLDAATVAASRRANPYLADRRPDLYGPLTS